MEMKIDRALSDVYDDLLWAGFLTDPPYRQPLEEFPFLLWQADPLRPRTVQNPADNPQKR